MTIEEQIRAKNQMLLELELAKKQKGGRRKVYELASRAAAMESSIAHVLKLAGRVDDAVVNLISEASCLFDAGRRIEAQRVLANARALAIRPQTVSWIDKQLLDQAGDPPARVFQSVPTSIEDNERLRFPQVAAFSAARLHFSRSQERALVQLPVGCGKTGTMAIMPFGIANGRALVVAPNLEIARNIAKKLDYASPNCFLRETKVLRNGAGPSCAVLGDDAQVRDADAADYVVANIQQLVARGGEKWLSQLSTDYFDMVLVDETHHAAASSWNRVLERFPLAKVMGFTATPLRSDGKRVEGRLIYQYPLSRAIRDGYVADIASRRLQPSEIHFTLRGEKRSHSLEEVMKLKEQTWFSRGVALSRECNEHIVDASIAAMRELRAGSKEKHQIIAATCSVDHAKAVRSLYAERGIAADVIYSEMDKDDQARVRAKIERGDLDAVVQVQMLGEGADYPRLSVAAVFRPFRHVVPYIQFIGRVMRVIHQNDPGHPDNRALVVSHVGLHVDRWWTELKSLDEADQQVFKEIAEGARDFSNPEGGRPPKARRYRPEMEVLREEISNYVQENFMPEDGEAVVEDVIAALALRGFNVADLGLSREQLLATILQTGSGASVGEFSPSIVQPQRERQEAQRRLNERVQAAAKRLLDRIGYSIRGIELTRRFPGSGVNNLAVAIVRINKEVNEMLGIGAGERELLDAAESKRAHDEIDNILDKLEAEIRNG